MQNITPLVSSVEKVVAAHRAILAVAETKAAKEREALAAKHAAAKEALSPTALAAADLANRLNALTDRRDALTAALQIGHGQLGQQQPLADEAERFIVDNFGHEYARGNPGIFWQVLNQRPAAVLAMTVLPRLKAWLSAREEELTEIEHQIGELAQSAKAPAQ